MQMSSNICSTIKALPTAVLDLELQSQKNIKQSLHLVSLILLKKSNMDASQLKRYIPVYNLPFLSKLLETEVHSQLQAFLDANSAMLANQSAYRKHHSTHTAPIKVYDDLLKATDNGQMSDLCLLDLTAATDTVDHELLLARLERTLVCGAE